MNDPSADSPVRLIYLAGPAHCGSTLLEMLLDAHSCCRGLGELKVLTPARRAKRERVLKAACPCGAPEKSRCPFWQRVDACLRDAHGTGLRDLDLDAPEPSRFARDNLRLLAAAHRVSGRPWLVDSSKSPRRLVRLLELPSIDLRIVELSRSPHGVVFSHVRKGRSTLAGALRYARTRRALDRALAHTPCLAVDYERLAVSPADELERVLEACGLELEPGQLDWASRPNHSLCGNRMRFQRGSEIRLDDAWEQALSPLQRTLVSALTRGLGGPAQSSSTVR